MSLLRDDPELERPVERIEQLAEFFQGGEKAPDNLRVGTEHEKVGIYEKTLTPVPYGGERGIGALLTALQDDYGFEPLMEGENIVGLERSGTLITLEPGGQLELAGAPLHTLHETCREFNEHLALMKHVSERFGILWLGLGIHPLARLDEMPHMPRVRHEMMREYLGKRDELGLWMMHGTGTVQANFDFESEQDAARKLRAALAISPLVTALYANSSISEGKPNGFESLRAWVWRYTDPDRCGLLPFVFEKDWLEGGAYARYSEWALDVPVFFIQRDAEHIPLRGCSFRQFLAEGFADQRATLADWALHLTTLFPEVRLKRFIEVRGADAVPPNLVCALPALWKGIFYEPDALSAALERFSHWSFEEVDALHAEVARHGLDAQTPDGPAARVAQELLDISAAGLARIGAPNRRGETEELFLEPLYGILDRGVSPARSVLERWEGAWSRRVDLLVEYAKY